MVNVTVAFGPKINWLQVAALEIAGKFITVAVETPSAAMVPVLGTPLSQLPGVSQAAPELPVQFDVEGADTVMFTIVVAVPTPVYTALTV